MLKLCHYILLSSSEMILCWNFSPYILLSITLIKSYLVLKPESLYIPVDCFYRVIWLWNPSPYNHILTSLYSSDVDEIFWLCARLRTYHRLGSRPLVVSQTSDILSANIFRFRKPCHIYRCCTCFHFYRLSLMACSSDARIDHCSPRGRLYCWHGNDLWTSDPRFHIPITQCNDVVCWVILHYVDKK